MFNKKSYTEILSDVCDFYDEEIAPKTIRRDASNSIYQVLKASAKGCEIISNSAEALKNRFDPLFCTEEDLIYTAKLVGTERILGKASGLYITVTNTEPQVVTLQAGEYIFDLDNDVFFMFYVNQTVNIEYNQSISFFAFSNLIGIYSVTEMLDMPIRRADNAPIHPSLNFRCDTNDILLGHEEETIEEFRNRILYEDRRQDALAELESKIRSLPYVFDARIVFNDRVESVVIDGVTLPPFYTLFLLNGVPREEIANIFCRSSIYPTVMTEPDKFIPFEAPCFIDGVVKVYYKDFEILDYNVEIAYSYDSLLVTQEEIREAFTTALIPFKSNSVHKSVITEGEFYDALTIVKKPSLKVKYLKLYTYNGVDPLPVEFVACPPTRIPKLKMLSFTEL